MNSNRQTAVDREEKLVLDEQEKQKREKIPFNNQMNSVELLFDKMYKFL